MKWTKAKVFDTALEAAAFLVACAICAVIWFFVLVFCFWLASGGTF